MRLDNDFADRKTEAGSRFRCLTFGAGELLEHLDAELFRYAGPAIRDGNSDAGFCASRQNADAPAAG